MFVFVYQILKISLPFNFSDSFDAVYYGGMTYIGGVYLGLPFYTEYTSVDQVKL